MKKNILNLYEGFFDDLDKLNQDKENKEFSDINGDIYDEHNIVLDKKHNLQFFKGLCKMCKDYYPDLPSNENGFTQKDLNQITYLYKNKNYAESYFYNTCSLHKLKYFNNLEIIGSQCFEYCKKLKSVILPKNIKEIGSNSFYSCSELKFIQFPENIKYINSLAFAHCISLEEIIIPKNIIKIDNLAFSNCFSLKKIIIPERFKDRMKDHIFYGVDLTKIDITYI